MTEYDCPVIAFEIGNRGYISTRNYSALYTLHKFVKPVLKLSRFNQNISLISVYSYYHIKKGSYIHGTSIPSPSFSRPVVDMKTSSSQDKLLTSCLELIPTVAFYLCGLLRHPLYLFSI